MKALRWLIVFAFAAVVAYQLLSTLLKANAVVAVVKGATIAADKTKEGLSKPSVTRIGAGG